MASYKDFRPKILGTAWPEPVEFLGVNVHMVGAPLEDWLELVQYVAMLESKLEDAERAKAPDPELTGVAKLVGDRLTVEIAKTDARLLLLPRRDRKDAH